MGEQQTDHGKAIDGLLYRIESKSNTDTVNSLKRINKFLKKEECRDVFVEKEGIKRLISRLETGLRQNEGGSSSATTDVKLKNDIIELILCALIKVTLKEEACKEKVCETEQRMIIFRVVERFQDVWCGGCVCTHVQKQWKYAGL